MGSNRFLYYRTLRALNENSEEKMYRYNRNSEEKMCCYDRNSEEIL